MRRHAPFEPIDPNICVGWGPRRNQPCNFFWKSTQGFRSWYTPKFGIPIDFAGRPYNTHTTVWACDD